MFSDMLFTAVCPLNDLQRFVVFKIILIFCTVLSFDYAKRITANFEDFIKNIEFLKYITGNILANDMYCVNISKKKEEQ